MPIKNLWFNFKLECIEVFLSRAFAVSDKYTKALDPTETPTEDEPNPFSAMAELEHAVDVLLGYQDIVFRAVYSELNALVELELMNLARSILSARGETSQKLNRGAARNIIEKEYCSKFQDLPGFGEVDEIRELINAYKHEDGFSGTYEEVAPGAGLLFGHREARYKLSWEKAHQSIRAVREFLKALPGERQDFPEVRSKQEDEAIPQARRKAWDYLMGSGALGHQLRVPVPAGGERGGYSASCELCGKLFGQSTRVGFVSLRR